MYAMMHRILVLKLLVCGVRSLDETAKDLLTPITEYGEACGYESCPNIKPDHLNVHIVPATHGELGGSRTFYEHYTGAEAELFHETEINMKNILDSIITCLKTDKARTFTLSDLTYFFYWWKDRDSTVRRLVYELIRQGRLFFAGGGWGMSDESTAHYHAIIDHYTYGLRKLNATFLECARPLVTWQADTFGHSREYASLMAQMGFDGHFINPISFDDEMARMKSKSLEFIWRGSDDLGAETDIFTHKLFDGYWSPPGFCFGTGCVDPFIVTSDSQLTNIAERIRTFTKQMVERQAPFYTTNNVMVVMGQRMGYHDAKTWFTNIDTLIKSVNAAEPEGGLPLNLIYSTPACYLKEVIRALPVLRTKQDDFMPMSYNKDTHSTGMYYSRPGIKFMARELHLYMQIVKQLQMFAHLGNNDRFFEDIQWIAGAILDHTIHTGAMQEHVNTFYTYKAHKAKELCMKLIRQSFNKLRNAPSSTVYYTCPFNVSSCWATSDEKFYVVIYNPLAWPVTVPVRIPVQRLQFHLYDNKGDTVEHSIISIPKYVEEIPERSQVTHLPAMVNELVFIAEKIPPLGFRSYYVELETSRPKRGLIKKMAKNRKRKFLTRQSHSVQASDDNLLHDYDDSEYLEDLTHKPPIIEFANVSKSDPIDDYDYILTPRSKTNESKGSIEADGKDENFVRSPINRTILDFISSQINNNSTKPPIPEQNNSTTTTTNKYFTTENTPSDAITTPANIPLPDFYDDPNHNTTDEESKKEVSWEQELMFRKLEMDGYHSVQSLDNFIKNEYIKINLNQDFTKVESLALSNGVFINLQINMMYYFANNKKSSPHVFKPMDSKPEFILNNLTTIVIKSKLIEEIQIQYSSYAGIAIRLYKGLPYVELDWLVGPIPVEDGFGREIFIRYATDLQNNDVFYTDSNGRQTIKRIKNKRYMYMPTSTDNVASNIYPITSKAHIEDVEKNIRFSVFPDRGEGCTSLDQGELDVMIHRRLVAEDNGITENLNETAFGKGLVIRGKHRLYVSKADYKPNKFFEKKFAKELDLHPQVFTSSHPYYDHSISLANWSECTNEYSAINKKVPIGVHLLSFEKWNNKIMVRLENYLEIKDVVKNGTKIVNILGLFNDFLITSCEETMLATNIKRSNYSKMEWQTDRFLKNFNDVFGNVSALEFSNDTVRKYDAVDLPAGIKLVPQQIRTFICSYELIGETS